MSDSDIGFKEISEVHRGEKRSKTLTRLPHMFSELAGKHLDELRAQYTEKAVNPSSTDALILQDNIKKIYKRLCQIYDLRERKIVIAALNGVSGSQPPKDMTSVETKMYHEVVETLKRFRECPEEELKEKQTTIVAPAPVQKPAEQPAVSLPETESSETEELSQTCLVQVLEEVPPFEDVDHTYILKKEDIVTLPEKFARILSLKGAVKILDL
ncbi:MAG: DNA replication complex GINS family protein [Thermoplasmata archaeon]|nr:DNA replication complex GINS family protein [Thermoplasmata archaeon]